MSDEPTPLEPPTEPTGAGKPGKAKKDQGKKDKGKKTKGKKGERAEGLTIVGHPRAGAQVRKAKGWGGLIAFGVTAYLSLSAGLSPDQAGLRALAAGIGGYLLGWACSVTIWRHLLIAELRALAEHAHSRSLSPHSPLAPPAPPAVPAPPAPGPSEAGE